MDKSLVERSSENFDRESLLRVREKTWKAVERIAQLCKVGAKEQDVKEQAAEILKEMGSSKNWHKIIVRFGANTTLYFSERSTPGSILEENDLFLIDIGPVWDGYEGDAGKTFIAGENLRYQKLIEDCELIFNEMKNAWRQQGLNGPALYRLGEKLADDRGWRLSNRMDGHRISEFPHASYFKGGLEEIDFTPTAYAWVLETHLIDDQTQRAAFFEDILF